MRFTALALVALLALSGCEKIKEIEEKIEARIEAEAEGEPIETVAPPIVSEPAAIPLTNSNVVVPVTLPLDDVQRMLEREIPRTLWEIDQREPRCIPPQRVNVVGVRIPVTPRISCRIVGEVTRGTLRLSGRGADIVVRMPIFATVSAREVAGVLNETAKAEAEVRAVIRLTMGNDWNPRGTIQLDYDWVDPPAINFLGIRIGIAGRTDPKLQKVVADLERKLPAELAKLGVRQKVERAWASAFTTIELNRENPPVWMKLTPQQLGFGGYSIHRRDVSLRLSLRANTETFIGDRPANPTPVPLPPPAPQVGREGFHFQLPVVAQYQELVPVLEKALTKLAAKGITAPVVGAIDVKFGTPIIYTTEGGRIAIGLPIEARAEGDRLDTSGTVWLTGLARNEPGSQKVYVEDLKLFGDARTVSGNLLLQVAQAPAVTALIQSELAQNFSNDFAKLRVKIDKALQDLRIGDDFRANITITEVRHGTVIAMGQGLFLPVEAFGTARMRFDPRPPPRPPARANQRR